VEQQQTQPPSILTICSSLLFSSLLFSSLLFSSLLFSSLLFSSLLFSSLPFPSTAGAFALCWAGKAAKKNKESSSGPGRSVSTSSAKDEVIDDYELGALFEMEGEIGRGAKRRLERSDSNIFPISITNNRLLVASFLAIADFGDIGSSEREVTKEGETDASDVRVGV